MKWFSANFGWQCWGNQIADFTETPRYSLRENLPESFVATHQFRAQRCHGAALLGVCKMLWAQIAGSGGEQPVFSRSVVHCPCEMCLNLLHCKFKGFGKEIVLGSEMSVETAVGESRGAHDFRYADVGDASTAEGCGCGSEYAGAGLAFVFIGPWHGSKLRSLTSS